MLFSATQTRKVEALSSVALKKEPMYVGVDDKQETATVEGLQQVKTTTPHWSLVELRSVYCCVFCCDVTQGYVVCPSEKRFLLLFTFLKKNRKKKVMVFLNACLSVKFYNELLNYIDMPVMCIHVSQNFAPLLRIPLPPFLLSFVPLFLSLLIRSFVHSFRDTVSYHRVLSYFRESKSRRSARKRSTSSVMLTRQSYFVLTSQREVLTFRKSTGLFSLTHLMTQRYVSSNSLKFVSFTIISLKFNSVFVPCGL